MAKKMENSMSLRSGDIAQSNEITDASYVLDTVENRLVLMAIAELRDNPNTDELLKIRASDYAEEFGVDLKSAYRTLQLASKRLFNRYIRIDTWDGDNPITLNIRWCDVIGYQKNQSYVYMRFTREIASRSLELKEKFTHFQLMDIRKLKSSFAIRLLELLSKWKSKGYTPELTIEQLRRYLGVEDNKHLRMSDFKKDVLDLAVKQVNQHSKFEIYNPLDSKENPQKTAYVQFRENRTIVRFQFYFREKKPAIEGRCKDISHQRDPDVIDLFTGKTDRESPKVTLLNQKQAVMFAGKIAKDPNFSKYAKLGEDMQPFIERVSNELQRDITKLALYMPYLLNVGYAPNKPNS